MGTAAFSQITRGVALIAVVTRCPISGRCQPTGDLIVILRHPHDTGEQSPTASSVIIGKEPMAARRR